MPKCFGRTLVLPNLLCFEIILRSQLTNDYCFAFLVLLRQDLFNVGVFQRKQMHTRTRQQNEYKSTVRTVGSPSYPPPPRLTECMVQKAFHAKKGLIIIINTEQ